MPIWGMRATNEERKETSNQRNGYSQKTLKTTAGIVEIQVPRDREGCFEPQLIKKRQRDVSSIKENVLSIYANGMSQRDISKTIKEIYGFEISHEAISSITDSVLEQVEQ